VVEVAAAAAVVVLVRRQACSRHFKSELELELILSQMKKQTPALGGVDRETERHTDRGRGQWEMTPPLCAHMPLPVLQSYTPRPPPDPQLKPGRVFVASGAVSTACFPLIPPTETKFEPVL